MKLACLHCMALLECFVYHDSDAKSSNLAPLM